MPTYEYRCASCGHELEAFQKITEPAQTLCPQCNENKLERLISGGNFVLKGGGWSSDNYGSPQRKPTTDGQQQDKASRAMKKSEEAAAPKKATETNGKPAA
jgi:putative FmdB family regulatory protein